LPVARNSGRLWRRAKPTPCLDSFSPIAG
jgi:hypothetical protein